MKEDERGKGFGTLKKRRDVYEYKALCLGKLKEGGHSEDLCTDGRIILKFSSRNSFRCFDRD
jgi:hypothetical protein